MWYGHTSQSCTHNRGMRNNLQRRELYHDRITALINSIEITISPWWSYANQCCKSIFPTPRGVGWTCWWLPSSNPYLLILSWRACQRQLFSKDGTTFNHRITSSVDANNAGWRDTSEWASWRHCLLRRWRSLGHSMTCFPMSPCPVNPRAAWTCCWQMFIPCQ